MKISFRSHPILERIFKGTLWLNDSIPIYSIDKSHFNSLEGSLLFMEWELQCSHFQNEINFITEPFLDAFLNESKKMEKLLNDYRQTCYFQTNDPRNLVRGTFILEDVVYSIFVKQQNNSVDCDCFVFDKESAPLVFIKIKNDVIIYEWYSKSFDSHPTASEIVCFIWGIAIFKKFAPVETVVLEPNSRNKSNGVKKVNDTKLKICYLDSKWFKTIVRADGFSVKSHIRMQPFGKGRSQTKCIFITEFQKHGYTIHAKKEAA